MNFVDMDTFGFIFAFRVMIGDFMGPLDNFLKSPGIPFKIPYGQARDHVYGTRGIAADTGSGDGQNFNKLFNEFFLVKGEFGDTGLEFGITA